MQNKLQELTDRLYQEGLSKGKQEGAQILEDAKVEAQKILDQAQAKADAILAKAASDAQALQAKAQSDVKMASQQALQATKKDIETALAGALAAEQVSAQLTSAKMVEEILLCVAKNFNAQEPVDLAVVLPEALKAQVEPWAQSELAKALDRGVQVSFSKKIAGGFTIGPADGSYFVSLTDQTFNLLIEEYLRPVTKKLLFGE